MKQTNKIIKLTAITLAITCAALNPLGAAEKSRSSAKASPTPVSTEPKLLPFHGKVTRVDKTARTFTAEIAGKSCLFVVSDETKVMKDTVAATFSDIGVGASVRGSGKKVADGKYNAVSVFITPRIENKIVKLADKTPAAGDKTPKPAAKAKGYGAPTPAASPAATPNP